ncbi:sigma-70 family RNA polymerase sigma factor [Priestia megaterium]|nr:sigma-70 family RNA polymerase sigma factor [Priestia megaterium]
MITDHEVQAAKNGDKEAFIRLIRLVEQPLFQTAKAIVRNDEDTADTLQETILKAYKSIHQLRESTYFKTWIFRILINECNTILSKRSRVILTDDGVSFTEPVSDEYEGVYLREALNRINSKQRIVIILHYFQDMTLKQIAETLSLSESAVKKWLKQAKLELFKQLKSSERGLNNYEPI